MTKNSSNTEELEARIEVLANEYDKKIANFDKQWDFNRSFEEYNDSKKKAGGNTAIELKKLELQLRMTKTPKLSEPSRHGDQMPLSEFIACVKEGGFTNYDGYGHYMQGDQETDIEIYPSDVKNGNIRKDFNTIIWFNR